MNKAQTRFNKIDPKLRDAGWGVVPGSETWMRCMDELRRGVIHERCYKV